MRLIKLQIFVGEKLIMKYANYKERSRKNRPDTIIEKELIRKSTNGKDW